MIRHQDLKLKIAMGSSTTPLHISLHARKLRPEDQTVDFRTFWFLMVLDNTDMGRPLWTGPHIGYKKKSTIFAQSI